MSRLFAASAAAFIAVAAQQANAQNVDCSTLPNPVFLQIGDTQENLIKHLGQHLRESSVKPLTLIYLKGSSCVNVDVFETASLLRTNPLYIPSAAEDPTWDPTKATPTCNIDAAGVALDIGNSATFISSCTTDPAPADVHREGGAVQGYAFVVPEASPETVITAEEAYFVYGFGQTGDITPWNTDNQIIMQRPVTASTQLTMMGNIGVPVDRAKGHEFARSGDLVTALTAAATDAAHAIGILGVEVADSKRSTINVLAFRAYDQKHAYFPDSTSTSFDKKNVRDGHYVPWSPSEWEYYVDSSSGAALNPDAKYVVDLIAGIDVSPVPDFEPIDDVIAVGAVPRCAMKVTRAFEGGELSLFSPVEPCGCYFESKVNALSASCQACDDQNLCASGTCRLGFCEER